MDIPYPEVEILAFGAHPDDVEIGAAGILARHTARGIPVAICDLTDGDLSSNGNVEIRRKEANRAAEILGLSGRYALGFPDRGLKGTPEQVDAMVKLIRKLKPKVVLAPHWEDRHPDHTACNRLVREAVFDAGIGKKAAEKGQKPHRVRQLLFYFINNTGQADLIVDVSDVYSRKKESILAFESQFVPGPGRVDTPLNRPTYLAMVEGRDQIWGHQIGTTHAEGLVSAGPISMDLLV